MKPSLICRDTGVGLSVLLLALMNLSAPTLAQPYESMGDDQILLRVPTEQCLQAKRIFSSSLRVYQRLPEFYFVGTDKTTYEKMHRARFQPKVIDHMPWSMSYALVSTPPPLEELISYDGVDVQVLYRSRDFDIVKGTHEMFESLRRRGMFCVEIERREIPVESVSTYLPRAAEEISDTIANIVSLVSDSMVASYIQGLQDFGTRHWSKPNRDSVFSWVRYRFLETGISDVVLDSFQYGGTWQKNVIATMPGNSDPTAEIIVGGHLDATSSNTNLAPGADDNASGTTAAIEMARVLNLAGYQPAFTLRFIGFAAEEAGLTGSADYASKARQQNRDIRVMMNYDMLGYRNQSSSDRDFNIVWYDGSNAFSDLHAATARLYTSLTPIFTTSHRGSSDSWSFYQQNYKTLFCIERDFNPYYHSPNDLLQYLDIPYASEIVKAGLAMLLTLDQLPPAITGLEVLDRGDGSTLVARWDSVEVLDLYQCKVSVGTAPGVYDTSYFQSGQTSEITGLNTGSPYYVGVSVVDIIGREGIIVEQSGVPLVVPRPPLGLSASNVSGGVQLVWQQNLELDLRGYNIYRSPDTSAAFFLMNSQPLVDTAWTDSSVTPVVYYYCVTALDSSGNESTSSDTVSNVAVGIRDVAEARPMEFKLNQNFPNPFNPSTSIEYEVGSLSGVTLSIFDVLGRKVATLVDEQKPPGKYIVPWDAKAIAGGVYFYRLQSSEFADTKKLLLIK